MPDPLTLHQATYVGCRRFAADARLAGAIQDAHEAEVRADRLAPSMPADLILACDDAASIGLDDVWDAIEAGMYLRAPEAPAGWESV